MKLKYQFTPEEKAMLDRRFDDYMRCAAFLAELHGLSGNLNVAPDRSGFNEDGDGGGQVRPAE